MVRSNRELGCGNGLALYSDLKQTTKWIDGLATEPLAWT